MDKKNTERIDRLLNHTVKVITIGIELFSDDLSKQNVENLQIDWKPPAAGDEAVMSFLRKLDTPAKE